jgi:hypothetical protein
VNDQVESSWTPADIDNAAPRFSADGRVALLRVDSGFQSEPDAITRCPNLLADMDLYSSSCHCDPMGRNTTQCKDDAHDHGSYFVSVCSRPIWRWYSSGRSQCANTGFNPDPTKVSFSCRVSSGLRHLPDDERRESRVCLMY